MVEALEKENISARKRSRHSVSWLPAPSTSTSQPSKPWPERASQPSSTTNGAPATTATGGDRQQGTPNPPQTTSLPPADAAADHHSADHPPWQTCSRPSR